MRPSPKISVAPSAVEVEQIEENLSLARMLYWQGWRIAPIARHLGMNEQTIYSRKRAEEWDSWNVHRRAEDAWQYRYHQLLFKEKKTNGEFKEMDFLLRQLERLARIGKYQESGKEVDLNPKIKARNAKPKKQKKKNFLTDEQIQQLVDAIDERLFPHQLMWLKSSLSFPVRFILKSRQIGATFTFSLEALRNCIVDGRNQIFISASKNQALVFKRNIIKFVFEVTGVQLAGEIIVFGHNSAELIFLGTNAATAQSYSGDLYMDEVFHMPGFEAIEHMASGMTLLDDRRLTYFSTPSTKSHDAYQVWSGEAYNNELPKNKRVVFDLDHDFLADGFVGQDGIWRQVITIKNAIDSGYNLITLEKARKKFPNPAKFNNLLMCEFIDDKNSTFPMPMLQTCMIDAWEVWHDFKPHMKRPFADHPVYIGYDPAPGEDGEGDNASVVVVAPPVNGHGFRCLEKQSWNNIPFTSQAAYIKELCNKYNVVHIGIDKNGSGSGVFQIVKKFYPRVKATKYTPETKNIMVHKLLRLINEGNIKWDSAWTDLSMSLITIKPHLTRSGQSVTYVSGRNKELRHADLAWALLGALEPESLAGNKHKRKGKVEIDA